MCNGCDAPHVSNPTSNAGAAFTRTTSSEFFYLIQPQGLNQISWKLTRVHSRLLDR